MRQKLCSMLLSLPCFFFFSLSLASSNTTVTGLQKKTEDIFKKGRLLYDQGLFESALDLFQKSLSHKNPQSSLIRKYMELCREHLSWKKKEADLLLKIKSKELSLEREKKISFWIEKAIKLYEKQDLEEALIEFEKVFHFSEGKNTIASKYIEDIKKLLEKKKKEKFLALEKKAFLQNFLDKSKNVENLRKMGLSFIEHQQFQPALESFKKLLLLLPNDPWATAYVSLCQENIDWEKKQKDFELNWNKSYFSKKNSFLDPSKKTFTELLNKGKTLFRNENFRDAKHLFEKLLELKPNHVVIQDYLNVAKEMIKQNDRLAHHKMLTKKIFLENETKLQIDLETLKREQILFEKGKTFFDEKKYLSAFNIFDNLSKKSSYKKLSLDYKDLCQKFMKNETMDLELEKTLLQNLLSEKIFTKGKELYNAEKYAESLNYMKLVLKKNSHHHFAKEYIKLSQKQLRLKDKKEEYDLSEHKISYKKRHKKLENTQHNLYSSWITKGQTFLKEKQYEKALECFHSAFRRNLDTSDLTQLQQCIERAFALKQVAKESKDKELCDRLYKKALAYSKVGDHEKALSLLEKVSYDFSEHTPKLLTQDISTIRKKQQRQHWDTLYQDGLLAYEQRNWKKALELFTSVYSYDSEFQDVYLYLKLTHKHLSS